MHWSSKIHALRTRSGGLACVTFSPFLVFPVPQDRQARGMCRHCVFPVLRRCQLHHWGNSGSGWRGPIPPLRTWGEPTRIEIGLQRLVRLQHSSTSLSHLCLSHCSPYTPPAKITSACDKIQPSLLPRFGLMRIPAVAVALGKDYP